MSLSKWTPRGGFKLEDFDPLGYRLLESNVVELLPCELAAIGRDRPGMSHRATYVSLISCSLRGEVRGYVRLDGEDVIYIRTPNHVGEWPEIDRAVEDATGWNVLSP